MSKKKRKVKYFNNLSKYDENNNYIGIKKELRGSGIFHEFGCNYEEFDSGAGNFSTAIIELSDGTVINHPVELIEFVINEN